MTEWKTWTPEYDGHAPDDWAEGMEIEVCSRHKQESGCFWYSRPFGPRWYDCFEYRYRAKPLQDATLVQSFDDLKTHCLALPQADRDALIEALQKRDWADDVWDAADTAFGNGGKNAAAAVIRSMCRPKEDGNSMAEVIRKAMS